MYLFYFYTVLIKLQQYQVKNAKHILKMLNYNIRREQDIETIENVHTVMNNLNFKVCVTPS